MSGLLVACLCAEWCGTCRDYHPEFTQLGKEFLQHRFVWIDIEDHAGLAPDIDIENFPTLLIARQGRLLFAGTMLPHIAHLRRLLSTLNQNAEPQLGKLPMAEIAAYRALAAHIDQESK